LSRRGREPSWPKQLPVLTAEQEQIREDFYQLWLKTLPAKYKMLERFDHRYPARRHRSGERTLDIGAGIGEQLVYEDLDDQEYYALDLRQDMLDRLSERFPEAKTVLADPQKEIPFEDDTSAASTPSTCSSTCPTCRRRCARSTACSSPAES